MIQEHSSPLEITSIGEGDTIQVVVDEQTPFDPQLTVLDLDGTTLYGPVFPDVDRNGKHYWFVDATAANGFPSSKLYRQIIVDDEEITGYVAKKFMVYVNTKKDVGESLERIVGLSGHNMRKFSHVWTNGLLTQFDVKIYQSVADLEAAEAGTADAFLAHYRVSLTYDDKYNNNKITSVKIGD